MRTRAAGWRDAWWQLHCRLVLERPPRFAPEPHIAEDRFLRLLETTWMAQQLPLAAVLFALGGSPWLASGVPVRIAVSPHGHWLVGHFTHRRGPQGWVVDGVAVQGHNLPAPREPRPRRRQDGGVSALAPDGAILLGKPRAP